MSLGPPPMPCSICGGIYFGHHFCGGSKSLSNLPELGDFTISTQAQSERRVAAELARLRARVAQLEAERVALREAILAANATLSQTLDIWTV